MLALPMGRLGKVGSDYAFGQQLGIGGFGVVREATCLESGEDVAVKQVMRSRIDRHARLAAEVALAASMRHPHVVKLYEVYQDTASIHLVMERCSGGELYERIAEAPLGVEERLAALWLGKMLSAVGYIHSRSIVHRDIKPENFLFEYAASDAPLKLTDFGFSCELDVGRTLSTMVGTPYYMAPEVLEQSYDERADIWSLGVINYALLSGRVPFQASSPKAVFRRVRKGRPNFAVKPWRQRTSGAIDLTRRLLTFHFAERPSASEGMLHAWVRQRGDVSSSGDDAAAVSTRQRAFAERTLAERVAMAAAAWHLPGAQTQELAAMYAGNTATLGGYVEPCSPARCDEELEKHIEEGTVDYVTWLAASVDPCLLGQPVVVKAAVRALDPDRDGRISWGDMCRAARALAPSLAPKGAPPDTPASARALQGVPQFDAEALARFLTTADAMLPMRESPDVILGTPYLAKRVEAVVDRFGVGGGLETAQRRQPLQRASTGGFDDPPGKAKLCTSGISNASLSTASSRTQKTAAAV